MSRVIRVVHGVNLVGEGVDSSLQHAQKITIESFHAARRFIPKGMEVIFVAVQDISWKKENEQTAIFTDIHTLSRTVYDVSSFPHKRSLPLISDIMDRILTHSADYYIYSNIDIALQPHYYFFLHPFLREGIEGMIVHRRRVPFSRTMSYTDASMLSSRSGRYHPGFDNFIMHASVAKRLILGDICLGVPFIGVSMAHNIFAFAHSVRYFLHEDLTFHLGMKIMPPRDTPYYWHNRKQFFHRVLPVLEPYMDVARLPYAQKVCWWRYFAWGRNPSLFLRLNMRLDIRRLWESRQG